MTAGMMSRFVLMLGTALPLLAAAAPAGAQDAGGAFEGAPAETAATVPAPPEGSSPAAPSNAPAGTPAAIDGAPADAPAQAPSAATAQAVPATPEDAAATATLAAGCFVSPAKLPGGEIDAFLASPTNVLSDYGSTSLDLSNRIRALVGSDPRTLSAIPAVISVANADQRAAVGAGLGRAAFACEQVNPDYAALIQASVAELSSPEVLMAFMSATNDIQVAALAAGAQGGGGVTAAPGLAGGGNAGPNSAGLGGDATVATTSGLYSIGNSGGASFLTGGGGGSTVFIIAVSPTIIAQ